MTDETNHKKMVLFSRYLHLQFSVCLQHGCLGLSVQ